MNNFFKADRFGKFFMYELNNARASFGLSLLIVGLMPAIIFFFNELFSVVFARSLMTLEQGVKIACLVFCLLVIFISAPAKLYGKLTEKRKGSDWLMIPASSFEKFLSMVVILCVALPVAYLILGAGSDMLLSAVFPSTYGSSLTLQMFSSISRGVNSWNGEAPVTISKAGVFWIYYASFCINILAFALGAICFKRSKAGKTILCTFAFSILLSFILVSIFGHNLSIDSDDIEAFFESLKPERIQLVINLIINLIIFIFLGGLLVANYFRIKTIKH